MAAMGQGEWGRYGQSGCGYGRRSRVSGAIGWGLSHLAVGCSCRTGGGSVRGGLAGTGRERGVGFGGEEVGVNGKCATGCAWRHGALGGVRCGDNSGGEAVWEEGRVLCL